MPIGVLSSYYGYLWIIVYFCIVIMTKVLLDKL